MIVNLSAIEVAKGDITRLRSIGWIFTDESHRLRVEGAVASPGEAQNSLDCFGDGLATLRIEGTYGDFRVGLKLIGQTFEIMDVPDGVLERFFDEPGEREAARRLEDRETDAALALPLTWHASADLDLGRLLPAQPGLEVRVVLSSEWLTEEVAQAGVLEISRFVPAHGVRRLYVALTSSAEPVHFGAVSFVGSRGAVDLPHVANQLPGEDANGNSSRSSPLPSSLIPLGQLDFVGPWSQVTRVCAAAFGASTWQRLATSVLEDGRIVEFLGFKRVEARLPGPEELTSNIVTGTQALYRWAFQDLSPDRLLAVRQVVSLYQDDVALLRPDDVVESAEVVFIGLRTEAVAEVLRGTREAQTHATESVRQSLKAVQDLTKSATERVLASLVAVAAVVAANSTQTLSDEVGRNLLLLVALFLVLLALFAVVLEGPLLSLPLRNLEDDLREGNPILTESQRNRAAKLPSVLATRRRVRLLRAVVPFTYIALALAILVWGYPQKFS
jgi:hypothetical protein